MSARISICFPLIRYGKIKGVPETISFDSRATRPTPAFHLFFSRMLSPRTPLPIFFFFVFSIPVFAVYVSSLMEHIPLQHIHFIAACASLFFFLDFAKRVSKPPKFHLRHFCRQCGFF